MSQAVCDTCMAAVLSLPPDLVTKEVAEIGDGFQRLREIGDLSHINAHD